MASTTKTVVIGLDGATWNYIKPLVKKGKLPTFKKLMEEAHHAFLSPVSGFYHLMKILPRRNLFELSLAIGDFMAFLAYAMR